MPSPFFFGDSNSVEQADGVSFLQGEHGDAPEFGDEACFASGSQRVAQALLGKAGTMCWLPVYISPADFL